MPRKAAPWYRASRGSWYVTMDGKQVDLGISNPDARDAALAAWQALLKQGVPKPDGPTVAAAVADFLAAARARWKPRTLETHSWYLDKFVQSFGPESVSGLTAERLEEDARRARWSSSTRHDYLSLAQAVLKRAGVVLRLRKPPKQSAGAKSVIPEPVFRRCLQHVTGDWHAVLHFLWQTGCRPGEASRVAVENTDWPAKVVVLREHKTDASGRDRIIFLNERALEILTWQRDLYGSGLLFRSRQGERLTMRAYVRMFFKLSHKVGHRVCAKYFRHTFATRALAAGESDKIVASLLGHATTQMVNRSYGHVGAMAKALRDAAERIGKAAG